MGIDEFKASSNTGCGTTSAVTLEAQLLLDNCVLTNNIASNSGGAINMLSGDLTMRVSNILSVMMTLHTFQSLLELDIISFSFACCHILPRHRLPLE